QAALALVVALVAGVAVGPLSVALAVAAAAAIAFVAVHVALRLLAPRIAGLISMLLLVSQIVLLPGLVPSAMLPEWMQSIAPALPLTWAMTAMQSVAASANVPATVGAIVALLALAAVAVAFATVQLARRRTRDGLGFVVAESA
ncbi:MAG TPA: hypothetical protein VK139_00790, partial [Microbacteriaceae bacterium]|nr:hypothetical protein [Microbacteriaceae bacterium]